MAKEYYSEQQQFNPVFFWIVIGVGGLPMAIILLLRMYQQFFLGQPWGDQPMSDVGLVLVSLLCFSIITGVILLFRYAKLEVEVNRWGVRYRFSPLISNWKEMVKADIKKHKIITYSFRGYGIRWGLDGIKTLTVKGNKGIEFLFSENKKIIIGTQQPELFLAALDKMMKPETE